MTIRSTAFNNILEDLGQLSEEFKATNDSVKRLAILKQMRLLIADVDKIIESEMGDELP